MVFLQSVSRVSLVADRLFVSLGIRILKLAEGSYSVLLIGVRISVFVRDVHRAVSRDQRELSSSALALPRCSGSSFPSVLPRYSIATMRR